MTEEECKRKADEITARTNAEANSSNPSKQAKYAETTSGPKEEQSKDAAPEMDPINREQSLVNANDKMKDAAASSGATSDEDNSTAKEVPATANPHDIAAIKNHGTTEGGTKTATTEENSSNNEASSKPAEEAESTRKDAESKDPNLEAPVDVSSAAPSAPPSDTADPQAPAAPPITDITAPEVHKATDSVTADNNCGKSSYANLRWITVTNDGKPDSMMKLVGLKSLFAKQLPKMPRAYIARLVFDRRHTSLAILSDNPAVRNSDEEIIGGICYRAFPEMRFAEIAFCAVNATHQVKGYGTKLMNLLKQMGARTGIEYFITYADNYAIGYFKKQGFTKNITMPKGRYFGLIKDYDGGTPMECYVHPSIDFTRVNDMIEAQREFILSRVALTANSRKVYPPLPPKYSPNLEGVSRNNLTAAKAMTLPGIIEAGWTMADLIQSTSTGKETQRSALKSDLLAILRKIEEQQFAWPFREPVDTNEVPDYLDVIENPIDLKTMDKRIRNDNHYKSKQMLFADLQLMVDNCKFYNEDGSTYTQCAINLEKFVHGLMQDNAVTGT